MLSKTGKGKVKMSERIANQVKSIGLEQQAVVVTGGALEAAGVRIASDIDLLVEDQTFRALREGSGWEERPSPVDGRPLLCRDGVEIGPASLGDVMYAQLQERGHSVHGVRFASLPDTYAWKQETARPKDLDDLDLIRNRLFDRPVADGLVAGELEFIRGLLPEHLADHPAAVIAANGLFIVRTLYGKPDERPRGDVRTYTGSFETLSVPATYHNYDHTAAGLLRIPEQAHRTNLQALGAGLPALFSDSDLLAAMAAYAYHDAVLGHGRYTNNPTHYDELQSAQLVERHLTLAGCTDDTIPEKGFAGVSATRFNQNTLAQNVDPRLGHEHIQVAAAGADLCEFAYESGVASAIKVVVEDGYRMAFGSPSGRKAEALGHNPGVIREDIAFIDQDPALQRWFAEQLIGSGRFCANHEYPDGWMLDDRPQRMANAAAMMSIGESVLQGTSVAEATRHVLHYT